MQGNPNRGVPDIRGVNIYTDGSKQGLPTGAGVVVIDGGQVDTNLVGEERRYHYHLGDKTTVFQSEVFASKLRRKKTVVSIFRYTQSKKCEPRKSLYAIYIFLFCGEDKKLTKKFLQLQILKTN